MKFLPDLKPETEAAIDACIEELIQKEKPLEVIQDEVKLRFSQALKDELGEEKQNSFEVPIEKIRTIHATLCARRKQAFECAGLFEDGSM